jgi:hypothetical protein
MVFPGKLSNFVNSKEVKPTHSFHVLNAENVELAITYTKDGADFLCRKLKGQTIERRPIFTQYV